MAAAEGPPASPVQRAGQPHLEPTAVPLPAMALIAACIVGALCAGGAGPAVMWGRSMPRSVEVDGRANCRGPRALDPAAPAFPCPSRMEAVGKRPGAAAAPRRRRLASAAACRSDDGAIRRLHCSCRLSCQPRVLEAPRVASLQVCHVTGRVAQRGGQKGVGHSARAYKRQARWGRLVGYEPTGHQIKSGAGGAASPPAGATARLPSRLPPPPRPAASPRLSPPAAACCWAGCPGPRCCCRCCGQSW